MRAESLWNGAEGKTIEKLLLRRLKEFRVGLLEGLLLGLLLGLLGVLEGLLLGLMEGL
jgi:ABC-type microcin C transport system permease subunit YejE